MICDCGCGFEKPAISGYEPIKKRVPKCSFCESEAVDSMEVECGNNAEYSIEIYLCEQHEKEESSLGYKFNEKYMARIEQINNERWY